MMGNLLCNTIEAAKLEIGVGRNLFSLDYKQYYPLLTDTWIKDVWKFANENNIDIIDKATKNLQLHRHNDVFIMEIIVNHRYSKGELQKINKCQLYLRVTTLFRYYMWILDKIYKGLQLHLRRLYSPLL
jgi:hypothetical protein